MKHLSKLAGLAIAGSVLCGTAQADNLLLAPAVPPAHPAYYMYEKFAAFLEEETGGEFTGTILGPEVIALPQTKDALQTGLVNIATTLPLYFAADFPKTSSTGDLALVGRSPYAMANAMTEFVVNCDVCQEEYDVFGGVYLGAGSSDVYGLLTTTPVRSVEDLQGLRLRSGGAPYSRWAENFGATPVSMSVNDTFEAMSQGTIDGTMASIVDMLSFRLVDVAKYVTPIPLGTYYVTSNMTVASDIWSDMTAEQREQVARASNRAGAHFTDRWGFQLPAIANGAVAKAEIEVIEVSDEFMAASDAFQQADVASRVADNELSAQFAALIDKWAAISAEVGDDPDAMAERAWEEIWSKVDFNTYGL